MGVGGIVGAGQPHGIGHDAAAAAAACEYKELPYKKAKSAATLLEAVVERSSACILAAWYNG